MSDELTFFEKIITKQLARIIQLMKSTDEKPTELQLLNREKLEAVEQEILHREENSLPEKDPDPAYDLIWFGDLQNVLILELSKSGMAYRILKEGCETWISKSHIDESVLPLKVGKLMEDLPLKNDRKWVLGKKKDGKPNQEWSVYTP